MRIVVATDSFKGSLSAREASGIIAATLRELAPAWEIEVCPLADGGEGTAEAMATAAEGELTAVPNVTGPLPDMRVTAEYAWLAQRQTAVVEMAQNAGLCLLPAGKRNPLKTTTFGTGEVLLAACGRRPRRILLGLGGSATVDGGAGMAMAMGWRLLDARGKPIPLGAAGLLRLEHILPPEVPLDFPPLEVLCDVRNPLLGSTGAARVFGPQKGATPEMTATLERALERFSRILERDLGMAVADMQGAGAAGGLGAGAVAFLRGRIVSGIQEIIAVCGLRERLQGADWVITGEGCFDEQSLYGKVPSGVRAAAAGAGVRIAVVAGRVRLAERRWREAGFQAVAAAAPTGVSEETAMADARRLLRKAVQRLAMESFLKGGRSVSGGRSL